MSIETNFIFFRGEDVALNFAMIPPTDVTGWSMTFTVRNKLAGSTQFTKDNGGTGGLTIVDAKAGTFKVSIAKGDTSGLTPGGFVYDVKRTDSGSNAILANGTITLRQEVTL
jgi:hypothetical protein